MQLTGTQKSFGLLNWGKLAKDGFFRDAYRSDAGVDVETKGNQGVLFLSLRQGRSLRVLALLGRIASSARKQGMPLLMGKIVLQEVHCKPFSTSTTGLSGFMGQRRMEMKSGSIIVLVV